MKLLQPAAVLIAWTVVMLGWMLATRLPALREAGIKMSSLVGTKASDADRSLPASAQWKAHNYNHLLEQPTLFYAVCGVLALAGAGNEASAVGFAWAYVALRVAHSLVQATINKVKPRFILFIASSGCLIALTAIALLRVF
ncbi:MAPEG family protein [Sphingomonas mucosissima]|uniref:MAPEG family protein n=1 Tax=Sphingomonas mucosissima TaxID=370959 RepID=A0A245ZEG1_9SPHN|nr:MAPEG family protein [Sphingomonas mucosissima]OWK28136.1 MAPEG family protein [Sphingomonas mucosissima]